MLLVSIYYTFMYVCLYTWILITSLTTPYYIYITYILHIHMYILYIHNICYICIYYKYMIYYIDVYIH